MHGDIDNLTQFIARNFQFDESTYPELAGASDEKRLAFGIKHIALHFSNTAGKIAASTDKLDHGKELQREELRENTIKSLINTLRLAELMGVKEADIIKALEEKYGESIE